MDEALSSLDHIVGFDEEDECPECGHVWTDDQQIHFSDCLYYVENEEK